MTYDLIIIGGGPAGAAGAVYAARKRLKTLFVTFDWGGQSIVSEKIFNWIGTNAISGQELADNLKKHVLEYKGEFLDVVEGEKVESVTKSFSEVGLQNPEKSDFKKQEIFEIKTDAGKTFQGKTVLVATGSGRRKLDIPNADRLEHKGITYCASCDGPLFADQDVVVIGAGNAAFETSAQLLAYCKSVTLLSRSDTFRADEITVEKVSANPKMKIIKNVELLEVTGEKFLESIKYKNKGSEEIQEIKTGGIFVEIGQIPNTDLVKGVVELDKTGKIIVDPMNCRTSVPGIWSAGDATNGLYHQNNIAAGDAVKALEDLYIYIHKM
jgi:alkyl hydroperoxide reductase subunit F